MKYLLRTLLLFIFTASFTFVSAETPCGNIIAPEDPYEVDSPLVTTPISNCNDPFGESIGVDSPYTLTIEGAVITESGIATVPAGGTQAYDVEGVPLLTDVVHTFYIHDGDDYRYVDTNLSSPNEDDYRTLADAFFEEGIDTEPYIQAAVTGERSFETEEEEDLFFEYLEYVEAQYVPELPLLGAGTYTLVSHEFEVILGSNSLLQNIFAFVIPTAHADTFPEYIFTLMFTIVETPDEPLGASNVLFLPGIQGSRLYKEGLFGTTDRVWEPNSNQDVRQLAMDEGGVSVNDIYTREIIDSAFGIQGIYEEFINFMDGLVSESVIQDWTSFAYDWRYSVVDIAENGTQYEHEIRDAVLELESLAEDSFSGKVTLIGHSNGGLLAKAIMTRLEEENKSHLVDRVIFLASPQLGTPLAIGSILHGYDQEQAEGLIIDDGTARDILTNLPGAYGLIPTQRYFNVSPGLVTFFDDSVTTTFFRTAYGNSINNEAELVEFMSGQDDGRAAALTLNEAGLANRPMLEEALLDHRSILDTWVAPSGVEVIEVVGIGLDTVSGFQYTEFRERVCSEPDVFGQQECSTKFLYKPVPFISQYGDKTVMAPSAEGYEREKTKYYVDLNQIVNTKKDESVSHGDFTETPSIQELLKDILMDAAIDSIEFISTTQTAFDTNRVMLGAHSPVTMEVVDSTGSKVGVEYVGTEQIPRVVEDITGSSYFEIGGSKYAILPSELAYNILLEGTGEGGLTFTLDTLQGEVQTRLVSVTVATITASTTINLSYKDEKLSNLLIDTNGDGVTDIEMTPSGEIVFPVVTYTMLRDAIQNLILASKWKKPLLVLVAAAEAFDKKSISNKKIEALERLSLSKLRTLLALYVKQRLVTDIQVKPIYKLIDTIN